MKLTTILLVFAGTLASASLLAEDLYERLGVEKDATERQIRVAFKKKAVETHPDKNPNDEDAHVKMAELNEAMSTLTEPNLRAAYDNGGIKAVQNAEKDKFKPTGFPKGFQNFEFYEKMGMYDEDPQVQIIDYHSWEASHYSTDAWIITFYSDKCTQCTDLAEDWRRLGSTLNGAFHVGAVNCDQEFPVCKDLGIQNLPAVVLFKKGSARNTQDPVYYENAFNYDELLTFAYSHLPNVVQPLLPEHYPNNSPLPHGGAKGHLWVVGYCDNHDACDELTVKLKLVSMIMNELVPIAQVNCEAFADLCQRLDLRLRDNDGAKIITYEHANQEVASLTTDIRDIAHTALLKLDPLPEIDLVTLERAAENVLADGVRVHEVIKNPKEYLIFFINQKDCDPNTAELGLGSSTCYQMLLTFRQVITALALDWEYSDLTTTVFNCDTGAQLANARVKALCAGLDVGSGEPDIVLLKEGALNPFAYHDRVDRDEQVLAFVQEGYRSTVHELDHDDFDTHIHKEKQTWFVDFFAPWCHHCRDVWPEWNLASKHYDLPKNVDVHFGKINCEAHHDMCNENHIRGYPTFLLFHDGVRHQFDFDERTAEEFVRFIKETLEPVEYEFTTETYTKMISSEDPDQMQERFVVDFFAPWCSHCHVMSPKFREAAKALRGVVKFGKMNCELDANFCMRLGIRAYPTIWRFEPNQPRNRPTAEYPGLPDPKLILDFAMAEVQNYVTELGYKTFNDEVRSEGEEDNLSWVVFFWSSKEKDCNDCEQMQMRVKALASRYQAKRNAALKSTEGKATKPIILKFASVNCRASGMDYTFCLKERIKKFPTLVYYSKANNEQRVLPMKDMLKVISSIDGLMQADRAAVRHPFREQHEFFYHSEL